MSISFIVRSITNTLKISQTVGFISRQDKIKHIEMGETYLIKLSHFYGESVHMQQSEQKALNKFSARKGDIFWLYHAKLTLVYLYSL